MLNFQTLKEPKGSSRQAILKYIMANFNVGSDAKLVNSRLKLALKRGLQAGVYKQSKGSGASGSFKLGDKKAEAKKARVGEWTYLLNLLGFDTGLHV